MRENLPELRRDLLEVIDMLNLPTDFELELRGYSKSYNGLYYPETKKVILYTRGTNARIYPWRRLVGTLIHEAIHHYQYAHDPHYKRIKGIMHDKEFNRLYEFYHDEFLNMLEEKAI